jgi:putative ABC transport system permease protein
MKSRTTNKNTPPGWATRFFSWYCNDHLVDAVLGDMLELYARRCTTLGKRKADLLFVWNVLQFIQPFAIRKRSASHYINPIDMFQNYFKIAWRNMSRQKMYSSIKVGGFALGLATCIVIGLFIRHELSYDAYYKDGANIYRVYNEMNGPEHEKWTAFPAPFSSIMKDNYPEIIKAARLIPYKWFNAGNNLFRRDDQLENSFEEGFAYADPELLDILEIPMIYGTRADALSKPNALVISKSKAEKYFKDEDPTGKTVFLNDDQTQPFTIGGVMQDFPASSHLKFDFLITLTGKEFWPGEQTSWCCWNYNPYIKVKPGTDPVELEKKLLGIKKIYLDYLMKEKNASLEDVRKYHVFRLQPVRDIYLHSAGIHDIIPHGDIRYMWLFGGIAVFILALACINFINLSTAKSANRAKEVGLRKVVGSVRGYLVRQFLTESVIFSIVSFVLAVFIVWFSLSYFNALAGKTLAIPWDSWWFFPVLAGSALFIGVLAGIYPALYLSAFKPIDVLKGSIARGVKNSKMRSLMVVFQFTTSIVLIIGTFIIYRQMEFILSTNIGYDKDQVIMLQGANTLDKQQQTFKDELLRLSGVENVTISQYFPVEGTTRDQNMFWRDGKSQEDKGIGAQRWYVDEDYINTMGMKLVEGRNFNKELASDSQVVIVNQAMAKALGLKKPLGERIMNWETYTIIGVVEDFHWANMKDEIQPLCFVRGRWGNIVSVKVKQGKMSDVIQSINSVWNRFLPHQPLRYTFLDESYARMYDDVQRMGRVFASFAVLAIIVACLGLFALSAFMVEQRNKEISIRLVLGASLRNIFRLLTENFIKLVLVSFVIAVPLAWYMMNKWLEDYKYRTDITWDVFIFSGSLAVIIALLTVSYQSLRAALVNPAQNLRSE